MRKNACGARDHNKCHREVEQRRLLERPGGEIAECSADHSPRKAEDRLPLHCSHILRQE